MTKANPEDLKAGASFQWRRAITEEEIRKFAEVSGDKGIHHIQPDADGRLQAHGLLTATLPTKVGGDLNYIARVMRFEFLRPVFSGDTLTCTGVVESIVPRPYRYKVDLSFEVKNQLGKTVLKGTTSGMILRRDGDGSYKEPSS